MYKFLAASLLGSASGTVETPCLSALANLGPTDIEETNICCPMARTVVASNGLGTSFGSMISGAFGCKQCMVGVLGMTEEGEMCWNGASDEEKTALMNAESGCGCTNAGNPDGHAETTIFGSSPYVNFTVDQALTLFGKTITEEAQVIITAYDATAGYTLTFPDESTVTGVSSADLETGTFWATPAFDYNLLINNQPSCDGVRSKTLLTIPSSIASGIVMCCAGGSVYDSCVHTMYDKTSFPNIKSVFGAPLCTAYTDLYGNSMKFPGVDGAYKWNVEFCFKGMAYLHSLYEGSVPDSLADYLSETAICNIRKQNESIPTGAVPGVTDATFATGDPEIPADVTRPCFDTNVAACGTADEAFSNFCDDVDANTGNGGPGDTTDSGTGSNSNDDGSGSAFTGLAVASLVGGALAFLW